MRIQIRKENRKSIAYSLAPEVLTIILPNDGEFEESRDSLSCPTSGPSLGSDSAHTLRREEIKEILNQWADRVKVEPHRVQIRYMKSKWASCSSQRNMIFNSSLTSMPREFVEYVVCHELLHLKIKRHNKLFRSLLSAYMPNWRERIARTVESVLGQGTRNRLIS